DTAEFLQGEAEREVVAAHPAVLLADRQPEQPPPAHPRHDVVGELAALVQLADHRRDHVARELLDGLAQLLVLLIEPETDHAALNSSRPHHPGSLVPLWGT